MNENEIEKIQGRALMLGEISGIEKMVYRFKKKAGEQFSIGQKKAAEITYEFAEELEKEQKSYREKFDRDYPK